MKAKKKKRQDDFQKVKLKVGKTKPKANNATNTNFRTKGIYLSEQLKKDTSGPTTHRQLGINVSCLYCFTYLLTCHHFLNTTNLFFSYFIRISYHSSIITMIMLNMVPY